MPYQACLDNIKAQTGKTPEDSRVQGEKKGPLKEGVKTGIIVDWLKKRFWIGPWSRDGYCAGIAPVISWLYQAYDKVFPNTTSSSVKR